MSGAFTCRRDPRDVRFAPESDQLLCRRKMTRWARSGIQLYPQSSEGKSSRYEATGDYLNSRCVYYKEEPKPATYGAP
jgi:hypothetical protein